MGLYFRKSLKAGPFRLNFSKSGISYSAGVKGARLNIGPRGTYVTLGANGIYYRQRISGAEQPSPRHIPYQPITIENTGLHTITSSDINQLTDVDSKAFIDELTEKASKISLVKWLGILPMIVFVILLSVYSLKTKEIVLQHGGPRNVVIIDSYVGCNIRVRPDAGSAILATAKNAEEFTLVDAPNKKWYKIKIKDTAGYVASMLVKKDLVNDPREVRSELYSINSGYSWQLGLGFIFFVVLIVYLARVDKKRFAMELHYEMDDQMATIYQAFGDHFQAFNSSRRKWQYLHEQRNQDWKRNAGAGRLVNRVSIGHISANLSPSKYLKTNVKIPCIQLRNTQLFFLPERLLIRRGKRFAAVFYRYLEIEGGTTRFIEDEVVAADARVVDHTWKYVNRRGGPDKRFNNNQQLPICLYSLYTLRSATGINEVISTSKIGAFDGSANFLRQIGQLQATMREGVKIA